MLSFISWLQYLAAVLVIGFAYYGIILLRYYREELFAFFQSRHVSPEPPVEKFTGNLIGAIRQEPGESSMDTKDLQFPGDELELEIQTEIQALVNAFTGLDQKDEFLSLLTLILSRYASSEINRTSLIQQIIEKAKGLAFKIDQFEIENAWLKAS